MFTKHARAVESEDLPVILINYITIPSLIMVIRSNHDKVNIKVHVIAHFIV